MPEKRRAFESATVKSFLAIHSNLLQLRQIVLNAAHIAAIGVANDDI